MGEVYEAEDTTKDRIVALKLLPPALSDDQQFRRRLQREAHIAGRLHEPHVVPIHGCGEIDGQLYVDMRLIDGTDLRKLLKRDGPLAPARAVAIVRQIAAALDAAHGAAMMHRDVKPENILIGDDDFACLLDFGIANAAADETLTQQGAAVGTFAYMAPERFADGEVTYRVDIYGLACVLHECLTASQPYPADSVNVVIAAHLTHPVPRPSVVRPGIPVAFDQVIARGMAKRPEDRFASADELARAANDALATPDQHMAADILHRSQAVTLRSDTLRGQSPPTDRPAERAAPQIGNPWPEAVTVRPETWSASAAFGIDNSPGGRPPASGWAALSPNGLQSGGSAPVQQPVDIQPGSPEPPAPWLIHPARRRGPWIFLTWAAVVVVAILGGLGIWLGTRPPQPPQPQPTKPIPPPSSMPTGPGGNANSDTQFLAALNKDNIVITDPAKTLSNAHLTCTKLSNGVPFATMVQQLTAATPGLSASQAQYFVFESVEIYCPENHDAIAH
jgi:serine/threonine-protein kinase